MKVMHYYTYPDNSGGPLTYIKNIISSEYLKNIEFSVCYQMKPFSALKYKDFKRIVDEIKAFNPDILHIHGLQSEGFVGLLAGRKAKAKKILMTVHGMQIDAQDIGRLKRLLFGRFIEPYTLKKSDAVYCVCKAMTNRNIIKENTTHLLSTIYNFVPDRFFTGDNKILLPGHTDKTIITYVGRLTEEKGMKEFEYCALNDCSKKTQYWIVGDGDYAETMQKNLKKQISEQKVVFFGQQSNVRHLLEKSDIFLFPTYHENLSIALLEAASQKCCCIVSDVGGNSEIVENGISGITFPPKSPQSTLKALNIVIDDIALREKYSENIFKNVSRTFSEKEFSKKLLQVYNDYRM